MEGPGFGWSEIVWPSWCPWAELCKWACERTGSSRRVARVGCKESWTDMAWRPAGQEQNIHGCGSCFYHISAILLSLSVVKRTEKQLSGLWEFHRQQPWASPCNKTCQNSWNKLQPSPAIPPAQPQLYHPTDSMKSLRDFVIAIDFTWEILRFWGYGSAAENLKVRGIFRVQLQCCSTSILAPLAERS